MSTDEKPPMPPQPTTVALEKPPAWAIAIAEAQVAIAEAQAAGFKEVRADIGLVTSELNVVKGEVRLIQEWRGTVDQRLEAGSLRAKAPSIHDIDAQEAIGAEAKARADRDELLDSRIGAIEGKVGDIHSAIVGTYKNPKVRAFARVLFTLAMGYAAARGIKVLP